MEKWHWSDLTKVEPRGQITFDVIKPYISNSRNIFEASCGFAPLCGYFKDKNYFAYDLSQIAIDDAKKRCPNGIFYVIDDKDFNEDLTIDTFIALGIGASKRPEESKTEATTMIRLINKYNPEIIVLEMCASYYDDMMRHNKTHNWDAITKELCNYSIIKEQTIDAQLERPIVSERIIRVYSKLCS